MKYLLLILLVLSANATCGQMINNAVSYRNIKQENYVRHDYENDFFTATDKYYTQGINMEVVTPGFAKLPTRFLLLHPANSKVKYGLALQHNAFTPTSITDANIRYGDRPYAASAMLQPFTISTNEARRERVTTMLSLGVTGQIAGGQWMQETIHRNLNNVMPVGWQYQVNNDAIINYRLYYEKGLVHLADVLALNITAIADAGTLQTKAGTGANIMFGYFESPYATERKRRFSAYVYSHAQVYVVGYDAMLQGGLLSPSVYTVPTNNITRFTADNRIGIVLRYGGAYIEYFRGFLTREFTTGKDHAWGGMMIGFGF